MSFYDAIRVGASGASDFEVERSLRFNDNDTGYLYRTQGTPSSDKIGTYSTWFKLGTLGTDRRLRMSFTNGSNYGYLRVHSDNTLQFLVKVGAYTGSELITTQVLRDVSAWYHVVLAVDTTQATASDRVKIYLNGTQITSFSTETYFSQNQVNSMFSASGSNQSTIGSAENATVPWDGYMAEINYIDGSQLTPSSFGKTNATTGQWNPIQYTGSYGNQGFYLNFSDNSGTTATTLGKDSSGNGNNFTPNNFSVSAGLGNDSFEDTPTNNFPTLNPNHAFLNGSSSTAENGNLQWNGQSNNQAGCPATMAFPKTGKWYWEVKLLSSNSNFSFGITPDTYSNVINPSSPTGSIGYAAYGSKIVSGSETASWAASFSNSDNIGAALDMDNNEIKFYKNNSLVGTISLVSGYENVNYLAWIKGDTASQLIQGAINFGGNGFVYTPPTGFKALNSANLPDPTILLPNKHFDTLLYTGTDAAASRTLTGLNFSPDWVWQKRRNGTNWHGLHDTVRGGGKSLYSNDTSAEANNNQYGYISAFTSDGFTWSPGSTNNSDGNETGGTFVSWCWNGGDTDGVTYTVKVVSDSGNKYRFNDFGTSAVTLDLAEGGTYIFNMDDATNATHPFSIGTAANGTVYTSGITYFLDGVSKTYSQYTSGFAAASTRRLHITVPASAPQLYYWCSAHSGMGGAINTNTTLGSSNFDGAIQSVVKVNASAGFSITTYTGTGSSTTVGHGLGVKPDVIIIKRRDAVDNWMVYHNQANEGVDPEDYYAELNSTSADVNSTIMLNDTAPTSTVVTIGSDNSVNGSSATYVMYCFSEVAGYSKFGSYKGNGSSDGTYVFTGFRPAWIMYKRNSPSGESWQIKDSKRLGFNDQNHTIFANNSNTEYTTAAVDILSNGFKPRVGDGGTNGSGDYHIYFAFAEAPFKYSRAR